MLASSDFFVLGWIKNTNISKKQNHINLNFFFLGSNNWNFKLKFKIPRYFPPFITVLIFGCVHGLLLFIYYKSMYQLKACHINLLLS